MESFAKVLSAGNRELLAVIAESNPDWLHDLARLTGRAKSSLSRTLRTMEGYGLVRLNPVSMVASCRRLRTTKWNWSSLLPCRRGRRRLSIIIILSGYLAGLIRLAGSLSGVASPLRRVRRPAATS